MDFLFGSQSASQAQVPDTALRIQTAVQGKPRPVGCGQMRFAANMIGAWDFQSQAQSVGGKGSVFGGGKGGAQQFTYTVAPLFGLCEGPIVSVIRAWDQQNKVKLSQLGPVTVILGTYTQGAWSYLLSRHPDQADTNHGLAQVGIGPASLGTSSALPNWSWEVLFTINDGIPGLPDADPRDWVVELLTNPHWSVKFPSGNIANLDSFSNWCKATGMVISDALVAQEALNSYLQHLAEATCSEFVFSAGLLKLIPYGDVSITGNGATYTFPGFTGVDLDDDDLLPPNGTGVQPNARVQVTIPKTQDFDNVVQVQYQDRANDYNKSVVDAKDDAAIEDIGYEINQAGVRTYDFFAVQAAALVSAHLQLGRQLVHNQYYFSTTRRWIRLDPMDIVTLTDPLAGLDHFPVRIKTITENQDGSLNYVAEEYRQGTGTPYFYNAAGVCCSSNILSTLVADPGPTVFKAWDASLCAVPTGPAVMIAAAGTGVPTYPRPGTKGIIVDWYYPNYFAANPTTSGTQRLFESAPNDSGVSYELKANFSGAGANVTIGADVHAFVDDGGGAVHIQAYADAGPQASIPAHGFGVIVAWDFTGTTWTLKARVNAGTVVTTTASESAGIDEKHPLFQSGVNVNGTFGTYMIGDGSSTSQMSYSQLWIGLDDDVDGDDLTISDATWDKFFCSHGSVPWAPRDLLSDGSQPFGCPPTFYFNTVASTGGGGAGKSTGCLVGNVIPTLTGTLNNIGTGTIPNCGSYQAHGIRLNATSDLMGPQPFGGMNNIWGSAEVWISTDGGVTFNKNSAFIPGASAIGVLTAAYASHVDPDTVDTLSVDMSMSQEDLTAFAASDADAGISRSIIGDEIIDYSAATLTGSFKYNLGTYIRRGQLGTAPAAHSIGDVFAVLGKNVAIIPYPISQIGTTMHFKLVARNKTGGGAQSLADVPDNTIVLAGPTAPPPPATLAITQAGTGGAVIGAYPASTGCAVTSYILMYDSGGPSTTADLGAALAFTLALAPGTYNFHVYAVNSAGIQSATSVDALAVVIS